MASNAEGEQAKRQRLRTPKAKPFLFDNSANESAIDWTLDQLSERTSFAPGLHASPLFRLLDFSPSIVLWRFALAAFALHAALRFCSYAIHVAAPVPHGAMTLRPLPHRSTAPTSRHPRCCVCTRAPIALWRWMLSPLLSHLSHLRSAAMGSP